MRRVPHQPSLRHGLFEFLPFRLLLALTLGGNWVRRPLLAVSRDVFHQLQNLRRRAPAKPLRHSTQD